MTYSYDDLLHQLVKERAKVERRISKLEFSIGGQIGWRDMLRATKQPSDRLEKVINNSQSVLLELSRLAEFHRVTEKRVRELANEKATSDDDGTIDRIQESILYGENDVVE